MVRAIRAILALLAFGASPGFALSQAGPVSGVVVDDQGRPVVAARVSVVNQTATTVTDNAGRFRLEVSGGPDVTLRVVAIGYRPYTQGVRAGDARGIRAPSRGGPAPRAGGRPGPRPAGSR